MKVSDITPIIRRLLAAFPHANVSGETLAVYVKYLADIPLDHLNVVVDQVILESEFLPTVAKIRDRYITMIAPPRVSAADAWGLVLKQILRVGYVGTPEFDDPIIARVVRGMGWQELCRSEDQMVDRAHFIRLYSELADKQQSEYRESNATRLLTQQQREQGSGFRQIGSIVDGLLPTRSDN